MTVLTPEGEVEKEITYYRNTIGMEFVRIPAGEFMMGSPEDEAGRFPDEGPQRLVRISRPFYMSKYPVTQAHWEAVMRSNPSLYRRSGPHAPVESVSWHDSQEFINKLSADEGVPYRLPTEAEWEYAARAGTTTRYYSGDSESDLDAIAWYSANSERRTHAVGEKAPNAFGLYDMSGNVWEWCQDWHARDYYSRAPSVDPQGPAHGTLRVLRGGGWISIPKLCRSANRLPSSQTRSLSLNVGFRVVVTSRPDE